MSATEAGRIENAAHMISCYGSPTRQALRRANQSRGRALRAIENLGSLTSAQGRRLSDNYRAWNIAAPPPRYASSVVEAMYRRLKGKLGLR